MSITSIYVGNLPYAAKAEDLSEIFGQYGTVSRATIILDRDTNRPRGFAFVEMPDTAEADAAVAALAGHDFMGRPLTVNCARNNVVRGAGNTSQAAMRPEVPALASPSTPSNTHASVPAAQPAQPTGAPASRGYRNTLRESSAN